VIVIWTYGVNFDIVENLNSSL